MCGAGPEPGCPQRGYLPLGEGASRSAAMFWTTPTLRLERGADPQRSSERNLHRKMVSNTRGKDSQSKPDIRSAPSIGASDFHRLKGLGIFLSVRLAPDRRATRCALESMPRRRWS